MSAQAMEALVRANEVRCARARVKRTVREGRMTVADAMCEPCVQSMRVFDLLQAQYGWGSGKGSSGKGARALGVLRGLDVNPYRPVGELSARQRSALVEAVEDVS